MATKFYKCRHCGNIIQKIVDSKVPVVCCGEPMEELIPNTVDASTEKHVPVVTRLDECTIKVEIGSTPHPMTEEHYIEWISLQTKQGNQRKLLLPGMEPKATFLIETDDEVEAVYAYCNLHSLWKA